MVRISSALFPMETTLAIIKPDALESGFKKEILFMIHKYKFTILKAGRFKLTKLRAEEFYDEHCKKEYYYDSMVHYMMRRPIYVMALARDNCVRAFRNLMGPKDADRARRTHPQSLRALFGKDGRYNAVHGSDSAESARREMKFFFPDMTTEPYPARPLADKFYSENIHPLLIQALTALAKQKPSGEHFAVCKWLAKWLHDHNPKIPRLSNVGGSKLIKPCIVCSPDSPKRPGSPGWTALPSLQYQFFEPAGAF